MSALSAHIGKLVEFSRYRECACSASYPSFVQSRAKFRSGSRWTRPCLFMRPLVIPVTTLAMSMSPYWRSANCSRFLEGMGSENMVSSGKIGLAQPPDPESKPLRLMISFLGFKLVRLGCG